MHRIQIAWFRLNLKSFSTTMNWYLVYCLTAIVYIMNVYYSIIVIILVERINVLTHLPSLMDRKTWHSVKKLLSVLQYGAQRRGCYNRLNTAIHKTCRVEISASRSKPSSARAQLTNYPPSRAIAAVPSPALKVKLSY